MTSQPCAATLHEVAEAFQSLARKLTTFARNDAPALSAIPSTVDCIAGLAQEVAIELRASLTPSPGAGGEREDYACKTCGLIRWERRGNVRTCINCKRAEVISDRPPAEAAGRGGDTVDEHGGSLSTKVGESPWSGARAAAQPPKESGGTQSASPPTSPAGEEPDGVWFPIWHFERRPVGETDEKVMLRLGRNTNLAGETVYITRPAPSSGESEVVKEWVGLRRDLCLPEGSREDFWEVGDRMAARVQQLERNVHEVADDCLIANQRAESAERRLSEVEKKRDAMRETVRLEVEAAFQAGVLNLATRLTLLSALKRTVPDLPTQDKEKD